MSRLGTVAILLITCEIGSLIIVEREASERRRAVNASYVRFVKVRPGGLWTLTRIIDI